MTNFNNLSNKQSDQNCDSKELWKIGKIDLSIKDGVQFNIKEGKCILCKGQWPLLANIELCQMCILLHLPKKILGEKDIIVPDNYMAKETDDGTCNICFEIINSDIFNCSRCRIKICILCVKKYPAQMMILDHVQYVEKNFGFQKMHKFFPKVILCRLFRAY